MDRTEREQLARVLAAQLVRVKLYRDGLVDFAEQLSERLLRCGFDPEEVANGERLAPNDAARSSLLQILEIDELAQFFLNKNCVLHTFESATIWISDNPVVLFNAFPYGDRALNSPGVEIHCPISSELVLSFYCPSIMPRISVLLQGDTGALPNPDWYHHLLEGMLTGAPVESNRHVSYFNELQVGFSSRFVFGKSGDFDTARTFLAANPNARHSQSTITVGEPGKIPRRANFPPGTHLVVINKLSHHMLLLSDWREGSGEIEFQFSCSDAADALFFARQGPFETASVYVDGHEIRRVRGALVEPAEDGWASVSHSDPAHRRLTAMIRGRRPADR